MKKLIFASLAILATAGVVWAAGHTTAHNPGTRVALTTTAATVVAAREGKHAACIKCDARNTQDCRFLLGAAVTTTSGIRIIPGESFCTPVGSELPYTGIITMVVNSGTGIGYGLDY